jgi:chaperonin GroEL (HSP60 family)
MTSSECSLPKLFKQNIATISAGNDDFVGEMIAAALDKVGSNGVLSIEASNSTETFVEVQEGMAIDRGYISPQFVTNSERLLVEYDNCRVLITDQKIENIRDIVPILEQVGAQMLMMPCKSSVIPVTRNIKHQRPLSLKVLIHLLN